MGHSERKEWRDGLGATVEDMLVLSTDIYMCVRERENVLFYSVVCKVHVECFFLM